MNTLRSFISWLGLIVLSGLIGCASSPNSAPVVDRAPAKPQVSPPVAPVTAPARGSDRDNRPPTYTVKKGDTLYGIALEFGFDYRELADWNNLENPNLIKVDQVLRLTPAEVAQVRQVETRPLAVSRPSGMVELKTQPKASKTPLSEQPVVANKAESGVVPPAVALVKPEIKIEPKGETKADGRGESKAEPKSDPKAEVKTEVKPTSIGETDAEEIVDWAWPTQGKVVATFNDGSNKGIDISGSLGQPVIASAAGRAVYSGSGLRGYGKLIIIKHNKTYLSAYAHNHQILVKEGQAVAKGQKIAEMGNSDSDQIKLHFEIRRFGKPVDPLKYLGNEKIQ